MDNITKFKRITKALLAEKQAIESRLAILNKALDPRVLTGKVKIKLVKQK